MIASGYSVPKVFVVDFDRARLHECQNFHQPLSLVAMRVCYIHLTRFPTLRANAVHVVNMCAAMAQLGHSVTLVIRASAHAEDGFEAELYDQYGVSDAFDIRVIGSQPLLLQSWFQRKELRRLLHDLQPDLIYSRTTKHAGLWTDIGIPYVYETHVMPRRTSWLGATKGTLNSHNFRRLVVISNALSRDFRSKYPELNGKSIIVAPDAAVATRFRAIRKGAEFCVGYVGHLYPGKGMETVAAIAPQLPDLRFDVVGGTSKDVALWRRRTGGIGNISFAGHVPHRDVGQHIAGFDLAIAPFGRHVGAQRREISRWFSPLKIFEYMAQGRAIVAADLPVLHDVLEHGRNAWLVEPENAQAWVDAIARLRGDCGLRNRLGRVALDDFRQRYTWIARARSVLDGLSV